MVLDEPFLFSVSVRDNIAYGRPDASLDEVEAAARAADADEFIVQLADGYDTIIGERGYTLSGGQRQRIAIARTLLVNPPILVLDDATSAVDVQVEQEIHESLKTLMQGRTTLIVAHRLSTIGLADRVVLLDARDGSSRTARTPSCSRPRRCTSRCSRRPRPRSASSCGSSATARRAPRTGGSAVSFGGFGGGSPMFGGGGGSRTAAAPGGGLPFAGIPPELQEGVNKLLDDEPDTRQPSAQFTYRTEDQSPAST